MLVVTRMVGEEIVIGDPADPIAVVRVVDARGDRIRLGVTAPRSLQVHRAEVAGRIAAGATLPEAIAAVKGLRP